MSCLRQERAKSENPVQNVVTVTAQEPAYLHCRIPPKSNHMVAWTRSSDQALLTAGHHSFTTDPRFQVSKKSDTDWILILRYVPVLVVFKSKSRGILFFFFFLFGTDCQHCARCAYRPGRINRVGATARRVTAPYINPSA
ncbi:unnamed protein product [Heligmosomoides polygyrus]|uniref:Ig-like domain-containing protein n=1 Tax=Heligmosomoides polygyrus TaxID=6339 RepID=A0A3P7ZNB8_HELPZ|nr:unnamed protein product [Heligmosomoides polygyrus]